MPNIRFIPLCVALALLLSSGAFAEETQAVVLFRTCTEEDKPGNMAQCFAALEGLASCLAIGRLMCAPEGAANDQLVRVFVKFAEERPAALHLNWAVVAAHSFIQAFPCSKSVEPFEWDPILRSKPEKS